MLNGTHVFSGFVGSLVAAGTMLLTAANAPTGGNRTLDIGRINIREPDGTLRMVLSSAALEPGMIVKGHEQPHPNRKAAGMLFFNDEGTENGGLVFDGRVGADGQRHSDGSLTFDRYEQDQVVQVLASEDGPQRRAGLLVNDRPEQTLDYVAIERARHLPADKQADAFRRANAGGRQRVFVGRDRDGSSALVLKDAQGIDRLVLKVSSAGKPSISFLDPHGQVVRRVEG